LDFRGLGPLALAGLLLGLARRRLPFAWVAVPLVLMVVIVAFFVCGRFRVPLAPMFALWAGYGVAEAVGLAGRRRWPWLAVYAAGLVLGLLVVDTDRHGFQARYSTAESHLRVGIHYASHGEPGLAEAEYLAAVEASPGFADGWNNLGTLYAQQENLPRAREQFERALAIDPGHVKALSNLSGLALQEGQHEEAAALARRILAGETADPTALHNAGVVLGNLGDYGAAETAFRRLALAQPGRVDAAVGLARALQAQGRGVEAAAVLRAVPESRLTPAARDLREKLAGENR
jgi:Tfp pilus assembly protein PilF